MWNGTMFVDLEWPLNASSLLSASAEVLVFLLSGLQTDKQTDSIALTSWCTEETPCDVILPFVCLSDGLSVYKICRANQNRKRSDGVHHPWSLALFTVKTSECIPVFSYERATDGYIGEQFHRLTNRLLQQSTRGLQSAAIIDKLQRVLNCAARVI